jgi:hypothetical protein
MNEAAVALFCGHVPIIGVNPALPHDRRCRR